MYEFVYCLAVGKRVELLIETAETLISSLKDEQELQAVINFLKTSVAGDFIILNSGGVVFRIKPRATKPNHQKPRPLMEVLDEAGLLDD